MQSIYSCDPSPKSIRPISTSPGPPQCQARARGSLLVDYRGGDYFGGQRRGESSWRSDRVEGFEDVDHFFRPIQQPSTADPSKRRSRSIFPE